MVNDFQYWAKTALVQGLNVLHVSHEVSLEEMGIRYDMMFSSRGSKRIGGNADLWGAEKTIKAITRAEEKDNE